MSLRVPPAANRMASDRAPTPFSPTEIAAGCRPGISRLYLITEGSSPTVRLRWEFTGGDEVIAEYTTQRVDETDMPIGAPTSTRTRWVDLQAHASYPADHTSISIETIAVPVGTFECWRYVVDDGRISTEAWFPFDLPGSPALKVDTVDGEQVSSMTLLDVVDRQLPS